MESHASRTNLGLIGPHDIWLLIQNFHPVWDRYHRAHRGNSNRRVSTFPSRFLHSEAKYLPTQCARLDDSTVEFNCAPPARRRQPYVVTKRGVATCPTRVAPTLHSLAHMTLGYLSKQAGIDILVSVPTLCSTVPSSQCARLDDSTVDTQSRVQIYHVDHHCGFLHTCEISFRACPVLLGLSLHFGAQ